MKLRPVGSMENYFLRLGPSRVTVVWVLDGPCDPRIVGRLLERMVERGELLRKRVRPMGPWNFWEDAGAVQLEDHVQILHDPSLAGTDGIARLVAAVRRLPLDGKRPRWRALIVNPATPGHSRSGAALSALVLHYDHTIADGIRIVRFVASCCKGNAPSRSARSIEFQERKAGELFAAPDRAIADAPVAAVSIPLSRLRRARGDHANTTEQLQAAGLRLLEDDTFFRHSRALTGKAIVTRFTSLHHANSLGNSIQGIGHRIGDVPRRSKRVSIFSQSARIRLSELRLKFLAVLPGFVLRPLVHAWYATTDQLVSIVPTGVRETRIGGRRVTGIYGIPPIMAPTCLTIAGSSYGQALNLLMVPGPGFCGDTSVIASRFEELLCGKDNRSRNSGD